MPRKATNSPAEKRVPLSRERVLNGALAVADAEGVDSLTMRLLADHLGVKPMALYHHVANKSEIIDGIVDLVFSEIELPSTSGGWRSEMKRRACSARHVLKRHPWSIALLQSRTHPGPATLRHHNAVIGTLRGAGFSVAMTAHAYALLDSYIYGFALSEASLPINGPETVAEVAGSMMLQYLAEDYPHLSEFSTEHILQPGYDFGQEFEFGLELVLDGLTRSLAGAR
ncbi:TetR/AcrR family transcriptional regulator [Actinoplanes sp. CA-051413]|uniref:TetR/AcrR family transcriptional regulator n=1 Tax=Actinoplanes sp. CA-051413 TaxID=3239899 RepID=UPI003D99919E